MKEVKDMNFSKDFKELINQMYEAGGFSAKHLAEGTMILQEMIKDKKCKKFFAFTADIVATGLRGLIAKAIEKGFFDIIVTTCGTLDHDLAKAWGGKYYHGSFDSDDRELHKKGMNRLGNLIIPNESYGIIIEKKLQPMLKELTRGKEEWSGRELIHEIGKKLDDKNSILYQASRNNIPIYVPGITDGAFGTNLVWFSQDNNFKLNLLEDEKELADIGFKEKKTGALVVGGGISKHHTIWWNQFKGGLDYAVYISTATEFDGSLSGARTHEAISWGKIKEKAKHVNIFGDATIILPIMFSALDEKF
jgi:deoxyhypusine synthase